MKEPQPSDQLLFYRTEWQERDRTTLLWKGKRKRHELPRIMARLTLPWETLLGNAPRGSPWSLVLHHS